MLFRRWRGSCTTFAGRKVGEVYVQAKQAIAQGRGPITYFKDGVPGGVSSRPDVRLGFEV